MSTLYMGTSPETVSKYVLFSGDPWRCETMKQYLDDPRQVAFKREFNTYTGTYKGLPVTVTSTASKPLPDSPGTGEGGGTDTPTDPDAGGDGDDGEGGSPL